MMCFFLLLCYHTVNADADVQEIELEYAFAFAALPTSAQLHWFASQFIKQYQSNRHIEQLHLCAADVRADLLVCVCVCLCVCVFSCSYAVPVCGCVCVLVYARESLCTEYRVPVPVPVQRTKRALLVHAHG